MCETCSVSMNECEREERGRGRGMEGKAERDGRVGRE